MQREQRLDLSVPPTNTQQPRKWRRRSRGNRRRIWWVRPMPLVLLQCGRGDIVKRFRWKLRITTLLSYKCFVAACNDRDPFTSLCTSIIYRQPSLALFDISSPPVHNKTPILTFRKPTYTIKQSLSSLYLLRHYCCY